MNTPGIHLGCAGWSVVSGQAQFAELEGTLLERYAQRLNAVEINSSFYRPHRRSTYARWAASTPDAFRFSVKVPKALTHTARLGDTAGLSAFVEQASGLGEKLGCLLVQLPPSLDFDPETAHAFFSALREQSPVPTVCEPRHTGWFTAEAEALLIQHHIGRVAADPVPGRVGPVAAQPGGSPQTIYYRWHGSPRMYYSAYEQPVLEALAAQIQATEAPNVWVIFDNTAAGAAVENALDLSGMVGL
ncbi:hypothetical protein GCM10017783_25960 [Deinococcus piscis]|uniref:DUF72 domain-containing protein n=1 Tax=Deinococcus piscis TaxID=394230 RepID=A0ABQ3KDH5_9DEIO|nr:DUF72 domain-containing protein [Deinococcus piscis]GHG12793.1 hypothetical protein GCM10017783_25960 [Deinococcus piscis]